MPSNTQNSTLTPETHHYKLLPKQLGKGAYSVVYLAEDVRTNQVVVAKRMNLSTLSETFKHEISIMQHIEHPYIVKLLGHLTKGTSGYIFMEKINGDNLYEFVNKQGKGLGLPEKKCLEILSNIVNAVDYLHKSNISHHDLKSENVVYDNVNNVAKVVDFGMSINIEESTMVSNNSGSPLYSAPEVLLAQPHDAKKSDIWSLGVMLYYMLVGDYPWENVYTYNELVSYVTKESLIINYPPYVSSHMRDLINKMLQINPNNRITTQDIMNNIHLLISRM
jgi:serine/threonine protein kinase